MIMKTVSAVLWWRPLSVSTLMAVVVVAISHLVFPCAMDTWGHRDSGADRGQEDLDLHWESACKRLNDQEPPLGAHR
ncbi:hypothetical protein GCM10009850_069130 [Nonomuraea monospora]|uniref:Secreted protein n=1 Tax=Nonomuraea monospora TaxID=568818 RepID=A0ABP5PIB0_9ACTN